ncbi:MAG: phage tail tube protein [Aigarchaeota archaeon]|nr:phage tail tube protein [Candidatus Calditenuaceae archaeon]
MFRRLVTFGEESSYGTPSSNPNRLFGWVTEFSGGARLASEMVGVMDGSRSKRAVVYGVDAAPSISFLPTAGAFLKYALGSVTNSGTAPPYTHEITVTPSHRLPSITVVEHRVGSGSHGFRYVGCLVERLEVSWERDGPLECSVELVSQRVEAVSSLPEPGEDAGTPYRAEMAAVIIDGVERGYATGGGISISNNHTPLPRNPDGFVSGHIANSTDIEATISLHYMDPTIVNLMLDKKKFDVTVKFVRGPSDRIEFQLLRCIADVEAPLSAEEGPTQELSLRAEDIKIVAVDSIPSY